MMETKNGIWDQFTADKYHQSSPKLAAWLEKYLDSETHVVDFGCGNAYYLGELAKKGFTCMGIEGEKLNNFHHDNILIADLTTQHLGWIVGQWAPHGLNCISLEVMEHIPAEFEQLVLDHITEYCTDKLILSWAEIGQPGIGHVNCVSQEYAINEVEKRGFLFMEKDTKEARQNVDENTSWFFRTLLIFKRI